MLSEWSVAEDREREGEVTCGCEEGKEEDEGSLRNHHLTYPKGKGKRLETEALQDVFHCGRFSVAEAGHPVSELHPLGEAVSLESGQSFFHTSNSSTLAITPDNTYQGEMRENIREICKEHPATSPTRETNCSSLGVHGEPGEQEQSQSEQCVPTKASGNPCILAETYTTSHHHNETVNAVNDSLRAGRKMQSMKSASLPVHRSYSDTLPIVKQGMAPQAPVSETFGLTYHGGNKSVQEAESHSARLACKQPMQLQQCNIITTICRGANCGENGVQQPQGRCMCVSSPEAAARVDGVEEKSHLPNKCDKALCYGSYNHIVNFEDTLAAYCHPQPIPAPSQLLPRLAGTEPNCDIQRTVAPPSATNHLTLPRLISSVSETGLDAKHLLQCCNLNCAWIHLLPPGAGPNSPKHFGGEECCIGPVGTITRDIGTMTTHKELRDVGVQTGQIVTPHVFPQICLAEESRSETSCTQTLNTYGDGGKKPGGDPKSPVKEVKWDAEGMTWEVYGASVDPEELGLAIQKHLELQIKETASRAAKLSRQNTSTYQQGGNSGCQKKTSRLMGSFQTPACCSRSTTAVD